MRAITAGIGVLALAALTAGPAAARGWLVEPARSKIVFDYAENGQPAKGVFTEIAGSGAFDPARPGEARLTLTVAVGSLDLGDPLESAFAQGRDWFDADGHPEAVFVLTGLEELVPGGGAYTAQGDLTIKGVRRKVSTPMTLTVEGDSARATGVLALNRREFDVGVGLSDRLVAIGERITVRFDLTAAAVK
jgi:polyisoprenoid-binding protein YceI